MVNYKILLLLVMSMSSCLCNDEDINLVRMDYTGTELRIDGYYFHEFQSNAPSVRIYFFYKNGIVLYGRSPNVSGVTTIEQEYASGEFYTSVKDSKNGWGVFHINSDEIEFERWFPDIPLKTFVRSGKILNDTTFLITQVSESDGSNPMTVDELYQFKPFSPKPDSTNVFIK